MSTGLECEVVQHKQQWYYILQDYNCPVHCWDWHDYATCYGPFPSEEAALAHLRNNHANPGGRSTYELPDEVTDSTMLRLIAEARHG